VESIQNLLRGITQLIYWFVVCTVSVHHTAALQFNIMSLEIIVCLSRESSLSWSFNVLLNAIVKLLFLTSNICVGGTLYHLWFQSCAMWCCFTGSQCFWGTRCTHLQGFQVHKGILHEHWILKVDVPHSFETSKTIPRDHNPQLNLSGNLKACNAMGISSSLIRSDCSTYL
jgi:hypothetical protein